jgi:TolB-like protein/Flp pilus assembly protein TadD/predicted Ser/Thr protein kinase
MIGQTISHYKILEKLGEGGMGIVYKAHDTTLDRDVALKFLPHYLTSDPAEKERFYHEARAASALNHPHITTIYEISEHDDPSGGGRQLFIAMEYVEGKTLKQLVESESLSMKKVLDIALQVCEGLAAAHEKGIVHRDIKSENILLTPKGQVKIMDFGLAKVKGATKLTKAGSTLGTAAYMSPEQAQGEEVDHRSDIFSFGVVLYELLASKLPFRGEHHAALMYSIINEEPQPVARFNEKATPEIEHIISKALAKDREERYQHADDLLADLRHERKKLEYAKAGYTTAVISPVAPAPAVRSKKLVLRIGVLLACIIVIGLAYWLIPIRVFSPKETAAVGKKMLIVLPFENLGTPSDDYFAEGLTGEITSRLGMVNALGVISRTTAVQYRKTAKNARQIGSECGVDYVLEGTVRWDHEASGRGRVRVNLELIRAGDDVQVWSNAYEKPMEDVFGVQAQITEEVIKQLDLTVAEPERQRILAKPTSSQEAYDLYLKAQMHGQKASKTGSMDEHKLAIDCLNKAVALDPKFALAYASLSYTHSWLYFTIDHTEKRLTLSKESLDKASLLEPDYGHWAAAWYYYRGFLDYDRALQEFDIVKHALPNLHNELPGYILRRQGKFEESTSMLEEAFKYDPRNWNLAYNIGEGYQHQRLFDKAIAWYDRALSMAPDYLDAKSQKVLALINWKGNTAEARPVLETINPADARELWGLVFILERNYAQVLRENDSIKESISEGQESIYSKDLVYAGTYWLMGDSISMKSHADEARKILEDSLLRRPSEPKLHAALGYAYAYLGKKDLAVEHGRRATELMPVSKDAMAGPSYLEDLARVYSIIGAREEAVKILEYLQSIPCPFSVAFIKIDPTWDPLRDNPRFKKLVGEKGGN